MTLPAHRLVLFDLDHTLVDADSNEQWVRFLVDEGELDRGQWEPAVDAALARYRRGDFSSVEYQEFFTGTLAGFTPEALAALHPRYLRQRILPAVVPGAAALIAAHRAAGDLLVLTSATNRFLTAPVARALGFEHLLATDLEMIDGRYTGRVAGMPNMREGKVSRLAAWLARRGSTLCDHAQSIFYSDSINDLPLLEQVTDPVAVDPDAALRVLAEQRGWPIRTLRATHS